MSFSTCGPRRRSKVLNVDSWAQAQTDRFRIFGRWGRNLHFNKEPQALLINSGELLLLDAHLSQHTLPSLPKQPVSDLKKTAVSLSRWAQFHFPVTSLCLRSRVWNDTV